MGVSLRNESLYLAHRAINSPLEALFTLLIFILSKELDATPLQLTLFACIKPLVSLFAFQVNTVIIGRAQRIRIYLMSLTAIGAAPCLFFPVMSNAWFYLIAYAIFMTAYRASNPAWIEILKNGSGGLKELGLTVTKGSSINYTLIIFIPLLLSYWMDKDTQIWKNLFFMVALFQLLNIGLLSFLKVEFHLKGVIQDNDKTKLIELWKRGGRLLKNNPAFFKYQAMFFLGGAGLVTLQPVIPIFVNETLHFSYTQLTVAFSVCKGMAFVTSAGLWAFWAKRSSLYILNAGVNILSCLFILFLILASQSAGWLFVGYLMYGAMQAGCELCWNISGPAFARDKESTLYSSVNLAFIGLRGCICPFLGQLIFIHSNSIAVFLFAGGLCVAGLIYTLRLECDRNLLQPAGSHI